RAGEGTDPQEPGEELPELLQEVGSDLPRRNAMDQIDPALSLEDSTGYARAQLGVMIPSGNRLITPQFMRYAPKGLGIQTARVQMNGKYEKPLPGLLEDVARAASTLADAKVDLIAFQCTATSMKHGPEGDEKIVATVTKTTGLPGVSTGQAVTQALRVLGI